MRSVKEGQDVCKQMLAIMDRNKLNIVSAVRTSPVSSAQSFPVASLTPQRRTCRGLQDAHHTSSALAQKNPDWVVYRELVLTTKECMLQVMTIEPKWLVEMAPSFFRKGDPHKPGSKKIQEKLQPLYDYRMASDQDAWRLSKGFHNIRLDFTRDG